MSDVIAQKIKLARPLPPVLGVGAYLKNALCLIQGDEAWISRDHGSLDSVAAITAFQETARAMSAAAQQPPIAVAHDLHPDFYGTRWALSSGLRTIPIQHHHAHSAAIMAEYGLEAPVLGLALDGFGLGEGNEAWGGELLRVEAEGYRRLGHFTPLPQPGGDVAARQPWRMGAAALWALERGEEIATRYAAFPGAATLKLMMDKGLNAPLTTSAGRLFDAACGLLGVKPMAAFEGEAPMALERLAGEAPRIDSALIRIESQADSLVLDPRPLLAALVDLPPGEGAVLFHDALADGLVRWAHQAAEKTGLSQVVLGGGCFFNKRLREAVTGGMIAAGLVPLLPRALPPGDLAIALGQAYAAALSLKKD